VRKPILERSDKVKLEIKNQNNEIPTIDEVKDKGLYGPQKVMIDLLKPKDEENNFDRDIKIGR
jgi:hypothetical protein